MLQRLRNRASDEGGFTLIELLVVILIIGILAAIAIPTFLNQTSKANDASAESLVKNAETEAQTIATDNEGSYAKVSLTEIHKYEQNIPVASAEAKPGEQGCGTGATNACLIEAKPLSTTDPAEGFVLTAESPQSQDAFTITDEKGAVTRTCYAHEGAPKGSCADTAKW